MSVNPDNLPKEQRPLLDEWLTWPCFYNVIYMQDKAEANRTPRKSKEELVEHFVNSVKTLKGNESIASLIKIEVYNGDSEDSGLFATIAPDGTVIYANK